ncbi:sulfotransferase family protein [Nocardioides sp. GXQ0305]|uniref:sulfotransferase family protein n=1 Tax=Nocardioides sp. GXQ0305 TaxID=3423912 RepID=UPI003D7E1F0C
MTEHPQAPPPSFIIAGAMRSGTTALTSWLRLHPQVHMSSTKEVHFFDRHYERGWDWYAEHFTGAEPGAATGEATPNYLYHPEAVGRMARDVPSARIVILLRDPIARAHSHYLQRLSGGKESLSFAEALDAEEQRLAGGGELERAYFSYADRGRYHGQLERLFAHFPREAVSIHLFEDLRDSPVEVFRAVAGFIGVDPGTVPDAVGAQANAYQQFRSLRVRDLSGRLPGPLRRAIGRFNRVDVEAYPEIEPEVVERLAAEYAAEREPLARLLGRDLHEWDLWDRVSP